MIKSIQTLCLAGCLASLASVSAAATDAALGAAAYRGQLLDNGIPAEGAYDLEFALYAEPNGGLPIDVIRFDRSELRDGRVDAPLDFIGVQADGPGQWVEVRMRESGSGLPFTTITPREPMHATTKAAADAAGLARAYDIAFTPDTLIGNSTVLLGNINVPAGSYVAFVRLQVRTGSDPPGNSFRLDCSLSPGFDDGVYRVGTETSVERYVTFQGAATLDNAGAIQFSCRDGNGHTQTALSGKLTVIAVDAID